MIDMNYAAFGQLLDETRLGKKGYAYLMDEKGEVIWHPRMGLLFSGRQVENNMDIVSYADGVHKNSFLGEKRSALCILNVPIRTKRELPRNGCKAN